MSAVTKIESQADDAGRSAGGDSPGRGENRALERDVSEETTA